MVSTTWSDELQLLARDVQRNPVFLKVGHLELSGKQHVEDLLARLSAALLKEASKQIFLL
jgi:hypothetical protein